MRPLLMRQECSGFAQSAMDIARFVQSDGSVVLSAACKTRSGSVKRSYLALPPSIALLTMKDLNLVIGNIDGALGMHESVPR